MPEEGKTNHISVHKSDTKKSPFSVYFNLLMFYTQQLFWFNSKFPLLSLTEEPNALALTENVVLKEESHNLRTG